MPYTIHICMYTSISQYIKPLNNMEAFTSLVEYQVSSNIYVEVWRECRIVGIAGVNVFGLLGRIYIWGWRRFAAANYIGGRTPYVRSYIVIVYSTYTIYVEVGICDWFPSYTLFLHQIYFINQQHCVIWGEPFFIYLFYAILRKVRHSFEILYRYVCIRFPFSFETIWFIYLFFYTFSRFGQ